MASKQNSMNDLAVSIFCRNMAMMLEAGTLPGEALSILADDGANDAASTHAAALMSTEMENGKSFAAAVRGFVPEYAAGMIAAGETAGRTEQVLDSLADYYERRDGMNKRLRGALIYPMILLILMCVVLGFLVWKVVPVFVGVYNSLTGSLAGSSYAYVAASRVFSWAALIATLAVCLVLVVGVLLARNPNGKKTLFRAMETFPLTKKASRELAVSRFADTLATYTASGLDPDSAMQEAAKNITHSGLKAAADKCCAAMQTGESLAQAMTKQRIFEPLYTRMLQSGSRSGKLDTTLARLADITGTDAENAIYAVIESIEPILTGFLTVAVGVTLLAAMLPLIGILGSIG